MSSTCPPVARSCHPIPLCFLLGIKLEAAASRLAAFTVLLFAGWHSVAHAVLNSMPAALAARDKVRSVQGCVYPL